MVRRIKLAGLIAAFLVIFFPSFALAQDINFGVSPAKIKIDDLPPGEAAEFNLTIHNKEELAHNYTLTTLKPPEERKEEGRAEFPDASWISFSSQEIELAANSEANVTVTVAIPRDQKWTSQNWEIWLGVAAESSDMLSVELYVRLLVSTNSVVGGKSNIALLAGIAAAIVLLGYNGYYYFRRKTNPE
jgi:uncharacterized membrane protein